MRVVGVRQDAEDSKVEMGDPLLQPVMGTVNRGTTVIHIRYSSTNYIHLQYLSLSKCSLSMQKECESRVKVMEKATKKRKERQIWFLGFASTDKYLARQRQHISLHSNYIKVTCLGAPLKLLESC